MTTVSDSHHGDESAWPCDAEGRVTVDACSLLSLLQRITESAAASADLQALLTQVHTIGTPVGLLGVVVWTADGDQMHVAAGGGYDEATLTRFRLLPLTANLPCSDAVGLHRPVLCRDRREMFATYPLIERLVVRTHALASFPIERHGDVVGGASLHFRWPMAFDPAMVAFLTTVVNVVATQCEPRISPMAEVVPLTLAHSAEPVTPASDTDQPRTLQERVDDLEEQMTRMRQLMMFLGAIANDRVDDDR